MDPSYRHLYAHFPFCDVICHYCDFYTARAKDARQEDFFSSLIAEAKAAIPNLSEPLNAIYLGGGTPSVSPPELLEKFLLVFQPLIGPETEITMEANPTNISAESLASWKAMGINRISLGVQSLNDSLLKRLGRVHTARSALDALSLAKNYIANVSGDLIYAVPGQEESEPAEHGILLAQAGATHISAYHLTLPNTHFLFSQLPQDSFAWSQIKLLAEKLAPLGFEHYEVSNFSRPGFASKNNSNYWGGGPYWALGPSAHGFDGGSSRWKNVADWEEYVRRIKEGQSAVEDRENLTPEQRQIEALFTSLRTHKGLDLASFKENFGQDLGRRHAAFFERLEKEGLAVLANGHFILTFSGRMLTDEIVKKLL